MSHKFDELAKGMAKSVTRRQALKKFGVGVAGMALACFGLANRTRGGTTSCTTNADCGNNQLCCSGTCVSITDNNNRGYCGNVCMPPSTCKMVSSPSPKGGGRIHTIECTI